jgi:hypothetical protein
MSIFGHEEILANRALKREAGVKRGLHDAMSQAIEDIKISNEVAEDSYPALGYNMNTYEAKMIISQFEG